MEIDKNDLVGVAKITSSFGIKGGCKIILHTHFPEILKHDAIFFVKINSECEILKNISFKNIQIFEFSQNHILLKLHVKSFNNANNTIFFKEIHSKNLSDLLKNCEIFSTKEDTRKMCKLNENEFFYFDIIGLDVIDNNEKIGTINDIEQIGNVAYFILENRRYLPYIDKYIQKIDLENKCVIANGAKILFE